MRNPINRRREHITFSKIEIQTLILDDSECLLLLNLDRINFRPTTTKKIITKEARRLCTNAWVEFGEKKAAYKREKIFRFDLCFVEAKRNYYVFCCCCFFFYTCHKKRISTPGFGDIILVFSIFFSSHLIEIEYPIGAFCHWIFHICCHRFFIFLFPISTPEHKSLDLTKWHFIFLFRISLYYWQLYKIQSINLILVERESTNGVKDREWKKYYLLPDKILFIYVFIWNRNEFGKSKNNGAWIMLHDKECFPILFCSAFSL